MRFINNNNNKCGLIIICGLTSENIIFICHNVKFHGIVKSMVDCFFVVYIIRLVEDINYMYIYKL